MEYFSQITGQTTEHLVKFPETEHLIHESVLDDFLNLKATCFKNGIELTIFSSFRDFKTQLSIWNSKAQGKRDLLDSSGHKLNFESLTKEEVLFSILRWSALPGMSRHHWGTDIDVFCANSLPTSDYNIELTPEEVNPGGCFGELHLFLDELIESNKSFNFFRPYQKELGGVCPEKWHLSHEVQSSIYFNELSFENFKNFLDLQSVEEFELLDLVKEHREEIYDKYIINISKANWK